MWLHGVDAVCKSILKSSFCNDEVIRTQSYTLDRTHMQAHCMHVGLRDFLNKKWEQEKEEGELNEHTQSKVFESVLHAAATECST